MAPNLGYLKTDPRQLLGVGASLLANVNYGFQALPRIVCPYRPNSNISEQKYFLPNVGNNLAKNKKIRWNPGDAIPRQKLRNRVSVAFTPEGQSSEIDSRAAVKSMMAEKDFAAKRLGDIQEIFPGLMMEALSKTEIAFYQKLVSTEVSGAPISFSANLENNPTTNAILQINAELALTLNLLSKFSGRYKRVGFIGSENWRVLCSLECYTNFASPNLPKASAIGFNEDLMMQIFKQAHKLDELHIIDGIYNSAGSGEDTELAYIGNPCVFALIDKRASGSLTAPDYDFSGMSDLESGEKPDGAIAFAQARPFDPVSWIDEGSECEYFAVRWADCFYSPRANDDLSFAIQFDPASIIAP